MTQKCPKCKKYVERLLLCFTGDGTMFELSCMFCVIDSERKFLKQVKDTLKDKAKKEARK